MKYIRGLATPLNMKRFHGWLTIFWLMMAPLSLYLGLLSSVTFISVLSVYALMIGHFSSWQAARVEVNQQILAEEKDDEFEARIESKVDDVKEQAGR